MMGSDGGSIGTSLGGMEKSPDRRKRDAARRKRQEASWARRSGPVIVRRIEPDPESVDDEAPDAGE